MLWIQHYAKKYHDNKGSYLFSYNNQNLPFMQNILRKLIIWSGHIDQWKYDYEAVMCLKPRSMLQWGLEASNYSVYKDIWDAC